MASFRKSVDGERRRAGADLLRGPHGIPRRHLDVIDNYHAQGRDLTVPLTDIYHRLASYDVNSNAAGQRKEEG